LEIVGFDLQDVVPVVRIFVVYMVLKVWVDGHGRRPGTSF